MIIGCAAPVPSCICTYLAACLQRSPHLLFGYAEGENIVVLVVTLHETGGAQQGHVAGAEVLKGTLVDLTDLHLQLFQGLHHGVGPEGLLLVVSLKVPGAQRHFAPHAGFHSQRLLVDTVVAVNLHLLRYLRLLVQWCGGQVTLDDTAEFEVLLQGMHTLILLAALWATWQHFPALLSGVGGLEDAGSTVAVATGENHRIRVELKANGTAQIMSQQLLWLGHRHHLLIAEYFSSSSVTLLFKSFHPSFFTCNLCPCLSLVTLSLLAS